MKLLLNRSQFLFYLYVMILALSQNSYAQTAYRLMYELDEDNLAYADIVEDEGRFISMDFSYANSGRKVSCTVKDCKLSCDGAGWLNLTTEITNIDKQVLSVDKRSEFEKILITVFFEQIKRDPRCNGDSTEDYCREKTVLDATKGLYINKVVKDIEAIVNKLKVDAPAELQLELQRKQTKYFDDFYAIWDNTLVSVRFSELLKKGDFTGITYLFNSGFFAIGDIVSLSLTMGVIESFDPEVVPYEPAESRQVKEMISKKLATIDADDADDVDEPSEFDRITKMLTGNENFEELAANDNLAPSILPVRFWALMLNLAGENPKLKGQIETYLEITQKINEQNVQSLATGGPELAMNDPNVKNAILDSIHKGMDATTIFKTQFMASAASPIENKEDDED